MLESFKSGFFYEIRSIKNSYYKLFLITLFPFVSFALIISIFYKGVAHELNVGVCDYDKSKLSKDLLFNINASPTININRGVNSTNEGIKLVQNGDIYALIIIEKNFAKDVFLQKQPKVTVLLNTQYILIGKILTSALNSTIISSSAQVEYIKNLKDIQNPTLAKDKINPIGIQTTPFFNTFQNYFYFLVSALLPAMWQIFIVIATLVSVGVIFKAKKESQFFEDKNFYFKLFGLIFPYTIAFFIMGVAFSFYIFSSWAFSGDFYILVLAIFLTVVAYQAIALLLFSISFDYTRSLSLGAVYTAPAFAFLGVTFPVSNMNSFALFWRDLLPIAHFVELQISLANYGASFLMVFDKLIILFLFSLLIFLSSFIIKKRLNI